MQKQEINPWSWQEAFGFAQAIELSRIERLLVCSGQVALDADGQVIHEGDMPAQVQAVMDNLETVLAAAEFSIADVVKLTIYTTDVPLYMRSHFELIQRLQAAGCKPAISLLGVTALPFPQGMVKVEAMAAK